MGHHPYEFAPDVLTRLSSDPHWRLAYVDGLAAVFVREGPEAERQVDRVSVQRQAPEAPEVDALPGLGGPPRRVSCCAGCRAWSARLGTHGREKPGPVPFLPEGIHPVRGMVPRGAGFRGDAYYEMYHNLGAALYRQKKYAQAAACFRVVLEEAPDNRLARDLLNACLAQR